MEAATAPPRAESDAPPEGEATAPESTEEEDIELTIEGDQAQLSLNVGGKRPTVSTIKLEGGEITVAGQFEKGTRLRFIVEGVVDEVATRDHRDRKTGTVTGTKRSHKLTMENVRKV